MSNINAHFHFICSIILYDLISYFSYIKMKPFARVLFTITNYYIAIIAVNVFFVHLH